MNERKDRLIGTVLDHRFRLDDLLGSGGMGKVYSGVQLSVERRVAVKVLREELSESETLAQRFFREARVVASLRHANVVGLVDFGRDDELGLLYIAMEYVDGVSLAQLLRRGRLEPALVVAIARQVCSALAEAHANGVIHRDLKPDNVMLVTTAEGALSVKVLDFGIALPTGEEARLTSTGAVVGTPHYMAPEQAQDRPITERSDVYSLGVLMYEMLTGRLPFVAETPMAVLLKVITQPPPPIGEVLQPGDLPPPELAQLMTSMLQKEPGDRPTSIGAVANELDEMTRVYQFTTPSISSPDEFANLVIERASDEFVLAETAASPVPSSSDRAVPVSTLGESEERPSAKPPSVTSAELDPPPKRRWMWFIGPLLFVGCCCFPVVNSWIDKAAKHAVGTDGAQTDVGTDIGLPPTDAGPRLPDAAQPREVGRAVEPLEPIEPLEPTESAEQAGEPPETTPRPRARDEGPSSPEDDGSVLSGGRGGTCRNTKHCNFSGGTVGCYDDSTCDAACGGNGGCTQIAVGRANVTFECEGGSCKQTCSDSATCRMHCAGGECEQKCFPPSDCKTTCKGGGCS